MPWAKPRYELLLLALVAVAALTPVNRVTSQDWTRMCQVESFVHARLTADDCLGDTSGLGSIDRSRHGGHYYSDKPPGMALLAVPSHEVVQLPSPHRWHQFDLRLWFVRLMTAGIAFVVCAFLVGRVTEGLAPGTGAPSLVTFALGTLASSFAVVGFSHVPAAALGFGAFLLLWRRRPLAAGLVGSAALLVQYEELFVVAVLAVYARRDVLRFLAGVVPGALLLAAYDWAAFGAPWHNPLSYSDNVYEAAHRSGFLGLHEPSLHRIWLVLGSQRGLLVSSPVLVAAAAGLVLLWRRRRAEALVCGVVTAAFLLLEFGYFEPYGGLSPGPRYFVPALTFLAVGLGPAFARWPVATAISAAVSIVAQITYVLTWSIAATYPRTVWTQLVHLARDRTGSLLYQSITKNALGWAGVSRPLAAVLVCGCAATAAVLAANRR